jgi:mannosyltransferase OCH1-like enzyme
MPPRRTRRKTQSKRKPMVHQIFFNIGKGELHEIPIFRECHRANQAYCKKHHITYKLWSRKQVEALLERPHNKEYKSLYYAFSQDIMRIDFARYLILWNRGGIYVDLDIKIIPHTSIRSLFAHPFFFVRWHDSPLPYNAILGAHPRLSLYKDILDHCKESYYEKRKNPIYKKWVGRFVFQTTGHFMLQRVLKQHKIDTDDFLDIVKIHTKSGEIVQGRKPLFEDANASVWYDDTYLTR